MESIAGFNFIRLFKTIGGAIKMNAGSYGGIKDILIDDSMIDLEINISCSMK